MGKAFETFIIGFAQGCIPVYLTYKYNRPKVDVHLVEHKYQQILGDMRGVQGELKRTTRDLNKVRDELKEARNELREAQYEMNERSNQTKQTKPKPTSTIVGIPVKHDVTSANKKKE